MGLTILLTLGVIALFWLMIWSATTFMPMRQLADFFPKDVRDRLQPRLDALDREGMTGRKLAGWACLVGACLGMIAISVYGGLDGVRNGFTYRQFLVRFLIMNLGVKAFDIIGMDYILLTKTRFFQRRFPETEGCEGWRQFGFNRKQQIGQTVMMIAMAFIVAAIFTWIGAK